MKAHRGHFTLLRSLFLSASLTLWSACGHHDTLGYSGTLQAESAHVGSTIGGRVTAVDATDGQRVQARQVLVRFDDRDQRAALSAAIAEEARAAAALADLQAGPTAAEVQRAAASEAQAKAAYDKALAARPHQSAISQQGVQQAQADLAQAGAASVEASRNYVREARLYEQGAVAAQALDQARSARDQAVAAQSAVRARLQSARSQQAQTLGASLPQDIAAARAAYEAAAANRDVVASGSRAHQIDQARAALKAGSADVLAAKARLAEMTVTSPAEGTVESLDVHPGDLVTAGAPVATIQEYRDPYVRVYVAQRDLGRVRVGARVHIRSDAVPDAAFDGTVEQIDRDAQFTPRDVETAEDRADVAFGVKVRVHDPKARLPGGTTVEVQLQ